MQRKSHVFFRGFSFFLGLINFLLYFSLRNCWSGMSKTLGYEKSGSFFIFILPVVTCAIFFFTFISEIIFLNFNEDGEHWPIVYTIVELIFSGVIFVIIKFGGQKYVRFAMPHFIKSLLISLGIWFVYWLLVKYPFKKKLRRSILFKVLIVSCLMLFAALAFTQFSINRLTYEPVVYAVEDEYQIVFSGSSKTLGSVMIDGKEYFDIYAGSEKTKDLVHKITVPMEELDKAGKYSVSIQQVWYRGPFGGILGNTVTKEYNFRSVDTSDGFKYLALSDVHADLKATLQTASYVDDCDLLVIDGDTLSMIDSYRDANFVNKMAHQITKGEYPVIYARGNHECKGAYAEELYKYVGSKDQSFYYDVHLGDVYCLVLDLGEDHDDDWWEFYSTAHFEEYRAEQLDFVKEKMKAGDYKESSYNMVVCHIPITFVNARHNHEQIKSDLTKILNKMEIDMNLCAHQHDIFIFEPGLIPAKETLTYNPDFKEGTYKGYLTNFNFWSLMVSKPGYTQAPDDSYSDSHICLVVDADLKTGTQSCYYVNSLGNKVHVVNPFAEVDYGEEFTTKLWEKKHDSISFD